MLFAPSWHRRLAAMTKKPGVRGVIFRRDKI